MSESLTIPTLNLDDAERMLCVEALARSGSIIKAARLLGITRHAFKRRIIKHGIKAPLRGPYAVAASGVHPEPNAYEPHGDVDFLAEKDGEVTCHSIGWLHGGGPPGDGPHGAGGDSQYETLADWSAHGWGLYSSGNMNDGYRAISELLAVFDGCVYLTMADFKAGRSVTIEAVIDAARAFVGLPPLAEDPEAVGPHEDDEEEQ